LHSSVVVTVVGEVEVGSLHPNHPGVLQVVEEELGNVFVAVGVKAPVLLDVVVVLSLHPNQPGVLQVEVVDVVSVTPPLVVVVVVVVSSRQPHQPGVLHVSVRVLVFVELALEDVVVSELLLSKYFHKAQS
jgi:hypothetical protein